MAERAHDHPGHHHDHDHEHVHHHHHGVVDHDDHLEGVDDGPIELNPIWIEDNVLLSSVGIDIGSSGTQIVFSRLHLQRMGEDLTSRFVVVDRATTFESAVALTPYLPAVGDAQPDIDAVALGGIIDDAYFDARQRPGDIDTGVVILTGEALRTGNAERVADIVSRRAGDLVCATAGHHIEALLAAYGSGAARRSHDTGARILNVDVGGGTTKLSLIVAGAVVATAALAIGGRQVVVEAGRIARLTEHGRLHARHVGLAWEIGDAVTAGDLDLVARSMASQVLTAIRLPADPPDAPWIELTERIGDLGPLDGIVFSGGVSEYIYDPGTADFGDLGRALGLALRGFAEADALPAPVLPGEGIRATVLGAAEYSVQLSGRTSHLSGAARMLPRRNLRVVRPVWDTNVPDVDAATIAAAVERSIARVADTDGERELAIALQWWGPPEYPRLRAFAEGIAAGAQQRTVRGMPLFLLVDADIARTLGAILHDELGLPTDLLVLDGLRLWDFDFIDLSAVREHSETVTVTIKSLVFAQGGDERRVVLSGTAAP